ncbi:hypothetical protein G205_08708 [Arthrobacter nitrophenolicus]|uniref:Uncharacterized protein n=1 Tax=Arthrobacter nitrophenolicus TaxID=683150 RepID=L8TQB3_9MICC|nr:hypothetical protein G205_08708 [Arthrobacter nitrophenolicus]
MVEPGEQAVRGEGLQFRTGEGHPRRIQFGEAGRLAPRWVVKAWGSRGSR